MRTSVIRSGTFLVLLAGIFGVNGEQHVVRMLNQCVGYCIIWGVNSYHTYYAKLWFRNGWFFHWAVLSQSLMSSSLQPTLISQNGQVLSTGADYTQEGPLIGARACVFYTVHPDYWWPSFLPQLPSRSRRTMWFQRRRLLCRWIDPAKCPPRETRIRIKHRRLTYPTVRLRKFRIVFGERSDRSCFPLG